MRILYVIARGDSFGGSSLHVMDMASRLEEDGHRARVLVGGHPDMETPRRFARRGIDFVCLERLGRDIHPLRDLQATRDIRREIKRFAPDLVSTHAAKGGALGRLGAFGLGIPVLYTPHCWSFVEGFPHARLFRLAEKWLAPLATMIVAVSEDERQFGLRCGVGTPERTVAIHNGVIDADPPPGSVKPAGAESPVRIVMVGRFEKQKDQALLLSALGRLKAVPWKLTFVGDGPLRQDCALLCQELGISDRVIFAGYSDRVQDHLAHSDIFALISKWEGFPRSILEAMRNGLPIVASDVGGTREAVLDGKNGRLVAPGNIEALEDALRELLTLPDRRRSMGQAARELYQSQFTFDRMHREYRRFYESLIGADSPARDKASPILALSKATDAPAISGEGG